MDIDGIHFSMPLFMITSSDSHVVIGGEMGKQLCLFTEEVLAELT